MSTNEMQTAAGDSEQGPSKVQRYGVFDGEGRPAGFYASDAHREIPEEAVAITEEQWREFIDNAGRRKWQDGQVVEYTPPGPSDEQKWAGIRRQCDAQLQASDWRMLPDSPLSPEKKNEWIAYRQALRTIREGNGNPDEVIWPPVPA